MRAKSGQNSRLCSGVEFQVSCPYCNSEKVSEPVRFNSTNFKGIARQCYDCLRVFHPDGTKIKDEELK